MNNLKGNANDFHKLLERSVQLGLQQLTFCYVYIQTKLQYSQFPSLHPSPLQQYHTCQTTRCNHFIVQRPLYDSSKAPKQEQSGHYAGQAEEYHRKTLQRWNGHLSSNSVATSDQPSSSNVPDSPCRHDVSLRINHLVQASC